MAKRSPGALKAQPHGRQAVELDADQLRSAREGTAIRIGGVSFKRRRKDWDTTRAMRQVSRIQETAVASSRRLQVRVGELEAEQIEAAAKGETDREEELEEQIAELVKKIDEKTETAELVTYRLLAMLLVPPEEPDGEHIDAGEAEAFGLVEEDGAMRAPELDEAAPAVDWLKPELDAEDAGAIVRELTGSGEPDPTETPTSDAGSS